MTIRRKVKKVIDGDTFQTHTKVKGSNFIRIAGKNSPEKNHAGGRAATQRLRRQIQGKVVTLKPVGKSYGRTVAKVRHNRKYVR